MKRKRRPLWLPALLLWLPALLLGLAYAGFCLLTGYGLACPFHTLTGFLCPGCGVTRMCLSLLRLDIRGAWGYNPALMLALPFLAVLLVRGAGRSIEHGPVRPAGWETALGWGLVVFLVLWGIARNMIL